MNGASVQQQDGERASSFGHYPALDGIRGLAAISVIIYHARIPFTTGGFFGVDVFFTLSGFLITSLLLAELQASGTISLKRFYIRRALRLLPAYVAVVLACLAIIQFHPAGGTTRGVLAGGVYMSNWVVGLDVGGLGLLAHTWSLSVEEQFYVLWPLGLLLLSRRFGLGTRLLQLVSGIALLMFAQSVLRLALGGSFELVWNGTDARAFELLAGGAIAVLVHRSRSRGTALLNISRGTASAVGFAGLLGVVLMVALWSYEGWEAVVFGWPLITLCSSALILCAVDGRSGVVPVLAAAPLRAVGKVSYGAYLWHFPIFVIIDETLGLSGIGPGLLGLGLTAVVTVLSYRLVERPFLRLKDRFHAPRPAATGEAVRLG